MAAFDRCRMKSEAMKTVAPDLSAVIALAKCGFHAKNSNQVSQAAHLAFGLYEQGQERNALPFFSLRTRDES